MSVLVLNAGSSSLRYQLVDPADGARLLRGHVERIGEDVATIEHDHAGVVTERSLHVPDHRAAMEIVLDLCREVGPDLDGPGIAAVGHRAVMGADRYSSAVLIDDDVLATVEELAPLAPLHNPPNLAGMIAARAALPHVPHVAVFDTAFFHDLPLPARTYAIDREVAREHGIRRYGFHGTSHDYVSRRVAEELEQPLADLRQIVLHLGNGASASAVVGGRPVETSMGFTPLEGLVMGTRTGDIDPSVVVHLSRTEGLDVDEIDHLMNHRSGMKGLTGHNDMREVHRLIAEGDADATLALDVYVHRLRKYIGAYAAVMGGLDALTFTAGVGENDAVTREHTAEGLGFLGISIDPDRNRSPDGGARVISPEGSPVTVLVVPTDEELAIAVEAADLVG
ncbi:MAG: acetate kinase [Acidimicrobiales bacterium]|nr:acetate kinase [Acidimicrobiales bacterium]